MTTPQPARPNDMRPTAPTWSVGCIAIALFANSLVGCGRLQPLASNDPSSPSIQETGPTQDPEIAAFYAARHQQPLWVAGSKLKPEARTALTVLDGAAAHGLDPLAYELPALKEYLARGVRGDAAALRRAEYQLSDAFSRFSQDIRRPPQPASVFYVDDALRPRVPSRREILESLAAAPSLAAEVAVTERLNPIYDRLRQVLSRELQAQAAPERVSLLRLNLGRARLLPTRPTGRYIVVDSAAAQLWMIDQGRVVDGMRVIVGKVSQPTPAMAGLIRFVVLNPYWHIPPDLVRTRVAAQVLRDGPRALQQDRLEIVSNWGAEGRTIAPSEVNWAAVAAGRERLRVRQLPGSSNMMGFMKFMMPNKLGIYLHDTPNKTFFAREDRRLSSGCVRVEDAARLARWMFGGRTPVPSGASEERSDLPTPVPVYITYLTAAPSASGRAIFLVDPYGRDRAALAHAPLSSMDTLAAGVRAGGERRSGEVDQNM